MVTDKSQPGSLATGAHDPPLAGHPIRILIAEDHQFVVDALQSLLSRQPDMTIVGTTAPSRDSIVSILALQPDVVLFGLRLDDESSEILRTIREASPARVIFLTQSATENVMLAAVEYGASAVLSMSTAAEEVIHAVRVVGEGGTLFTPQTIASALMRRRATDGMRDRLTHREREALSLMSEGWSNREIARKMGITYTTVRSHIRHVASKLGAHSKLEVLVEAQRLELVGKAWPVQAARGAHSYVRDLAATK